MGICAGVGVQADARLFEEAALFVQREIAVGYVVAETAEGVRDIYGAPLLRHQLTRTRPDIVKWKAGIHAFGLASDILFGLSSRGYDVRRTKLNATPRRT
jgi:hypothetical protein